MKRRFSNSHGGRTSGKEESAAERPAKRRRQASASDAQSAPSAPSEAAKLPLIFHEPEPAAATTTTAATSATSEPNDASPARAKKGKRFVQSKAALGALIDEIVAKEETTAAQRLQNSEARVQRFEQAELQRRQRRERRKQAAKTAVQSVLAESRKASTTTARPGKAARAVAAGGKRAPRL